MKILRKMLKKLCCKKIKKRDKHYPWQQTEYIIIENKKNSTIST